MKNDTLFLCKGTYYSAFLAKRNMIHVKILQLIQEPGYLSQYSVWLWTGWSWLYPQRERIFPLASVSKPALGPTQPSHPMGTRGPFPRGKVRPGHDTDYSPPHLVLRSRMSWSYNFSPPNTFMACSGTALQFIWIAISEYINRRIQLLCLKRYVFMALSF
jgi:hypothetical protein